MKAIISNHSFGNIRHQVFINKANLGDLLALYFSLWRSELENGSESAFKMTFVAIVSTVFEYINHLSH